MQERQFCIWTGGGPFDPEDGRRAEAIPPLPAPAPLPRAAVISYWWGKVAFEMAAVACSVRTTPWGARKMTWLHCKASQVTGACPWDR